MDYFVQKLTEIIAAPLQCDDERRAVIQYGMFALVQMVAIALVITIFGVVTGCLWECWIVYLVAGLLRKSTGGAHANTSNGCLVVSILAVSVIGFGSRYVIALPYGYSIGLTACTVAFAVGCLLIYCLAPVGSPNKPLTSPKKIKRLRRQSLITLLVYAGIGVIFIVVSLDYERGLSLAVSIGLAVLWQSLTLVKEVIKHRNAPA